MDAPELPESARAAWRAYRAMQESKQQHFDYLQLLEDKYSKYGRPTEAEERHRRALLAVHDARVGAFRAALDALRQADPPAFALLVRRMSEQD